MRRLLMSVLGLSYNTKLIAALPAAFLTTMLAALTITTNLRLAEYVLLGLLHLIIAYLFLSLLWSPLTWFRKQFLQPRQALILSMLLSVPLAGWFCSIYPYELLDTVFTFGLKPGPVLAIVFAIHLLCFFAFTWSLGNLWVPSLFFVKIGKPRISFKKQVREDRDDLETRRILSEAPFRPHLLFGALSFFLGLYFIFILEWWMVNVNLTASRLADNRPVTTVVMIQSLVEKEEAGFLRVPRVLQPYKSILPAVRPSPSPPLLFNLHQPDARPVSRVGTTLAQSDSSRSGSPLDGVTAIRPSRGNLVRENSVTARWQDEIHNWLCQLLPLLSITLGGTILLYLFGVVPLRLMSFVLPAVSHKDATYRARIRHTPTYVWQFYLAVLALNPLFSMAGLLMCIFLIAMPLIVVMSGTPELLSAMVGPDQILFSFTLLAAWASPIAYAGVYVDRTFGTYFHTKLANLILGMRGHTVVFGYGYLGRRVVDRELMKLNVRSRGHSRAPHFEKIVSPELEIEELCPHFILVDREMSSALYVGSDSSLGRFGTVAALASQQFPADFPGGTDESLSPEPHRRVLVPIVQGDATDPFTLARVNFERASFLISTISEEERIRDIFTHATETGLRAIVCVSRRDQMIDLTTKATHHPITLVYPKQNSGFSLGQRLLAATLKVHPRPLTDKSWPRIMVVGSNKSNHFMLETLWHNWPEMDLKKKAGIFARMLRFVVTSEQAVYGTPSPGQDSPRAMTAGWRGLKEMLSEGSLAPRPNPKKSYFNRWWRCSYITGFRFRKASEYDRPLYLAVPTCVMQIDEGGVLERCLHEFRPDIMVINDDNVDRSLMLLQRALNTLERLKFESADFPLPEILMRSARGDEAEHRDIGDALRLYAAQTQLYKGRQWTGHPRPAHFRRQLPRRLVGESVHDALDDTVEIISGIRDIWEQVAEPIFEKQRPVALDEILSGTWGKAFELNTCIPNCAGAVAGLTARLAGLEFAPLPRTDIDRIFTKSSRTPSVEGQVILRPSFQYLRHLTLEVAGRGFCLTGYADLQEDSVDEFISGDCGRTAAIAMRTYAKDDCDYREFNPRDPRYGDLTVPRLIHLTTGDSNRQLETSTFVEVMMGNSSTAEPGETYCPGMTVCPIASYQHNVVASHSQEIATWQFHDRNGIIRNAPNYGCAKIQLPPSARRREVHSLPQYARIFCCCHAERNDPGIIAVALNTLNFHRFNELYDRAQREQNLDNDWVANLEYFKNSSCQNRLFTYSRLFGVRRFTKELLRENNWTMADYEARLRNIQPICLLQIMPVGGPERARRWFEYAVALYRFLWLEAPRPYSFQWWDQNERRHTRHRLAPDSEEYPVIIQINNRQHRLRERLKQQGRCEFCRVEDPNSAFGCVQRRPWL